MGLFSETNSIPLVINIKKRWRPQNDHVTLVLHTLTLCNVRKTTPTKAHVQRRKMNSLRKQPSFRRNSVVMTCYHLDLGSASDIMKQIFRSTTQVWVVMRHLDGNNRWRPKIWAIFLG